MSILAKTVKPIEVRGDLANRPSQVYGTTARRNLSGGENVESRNATVDTEYGVQ